MAELKPIEHVVTIAVYGTRKARRRAIAAIERMPQPSRKMYVTRSHGIATAALRVNVEFKIIEHWRPWPTAFVVIEPC